jgi:hypothetical protein
MVGAGKGSEDRKMSQRRAHSNTNSYNITIPLSKFFQAKKKNAMRWRASAQTANGMARISPNPHLHVACLLVHNELRQMMEHGLQDI